MKRKTHKIHFLLHSADLIEEQLRLRLQTHGIGPRQARVIEALARMESLSQVELADAFAITAASMSTMTMRLMEAGYVSRRADKLSRRTNVLRLTPKGLALLQVIYAAWADMDQLIVDTVGAQKAEQLAKLTKSLRDGLGGKPPGSAQRRKENRSTDRLDNSKGKRYP